MNFGVRGHDIKASSIAELSDKCKEYGLKSVQLVLKKSIEGFSEGMFSPAYAMHIGDEFRRNNIDVAILGCYINPSNTNTEQLKKDMDYFVESLKYAKFIGAGAVGLETGFVGDRCIPEDNHTEQAYAYLLKNMKELCNAAEKLGVMIAIEGVRPFVINSPQKLRRLVDDLNSPNICVIFDPLNYLDHSNFKDQDKIITDMFDLLKDKMAAIHLKDFVDNGQGLSYVTPYEGQMNIDLIMSLANKYKPEIPIILEEIKEENIQKVIKR